MQALKLTHDSAAKKQLSTRVKVLLSRAEKIKATGIWDETLPSRHVVAGDVNRPKIKRLRAPVSTRQLTTVEKIIVLKASYLNGHKFPPWKSDPTKDEFDLLEGQNLFVCVNTCSLINIPQADLFRVTKQNFRFPRAS